jgi:hypothetical protein
MGLEGLKTASTAGVGSILSPWATTPPTMDGTIGAGEWSDAISFDLSTSATPVLVYLMNDANYLYLAVDNQVDTALDPRDFAGLGFDDEGGTPPLLSDGLWNTLTCPVTEEGIYGIGSFIAVGETSDNVFQGVSAAGFCLVDANTGSEGAYSLASGNMAFEMRIDLTASNLQAQPGETFGALITILDSGTSSRWRTSEPSHDVSQYLGLTLAEMPVQVNPSTWGRVKSTYR